MTTPTCTPADLIPVAISATGFFLIQACNLMGYLPLLRFCRQKAHPASSETELPPVSVILSTHNEAHRLKELLPLLLTQDYPKFELIVINDNSTDDTEDLLKTLEQQYSHLRHSFIPPTARYVSRKKLSLTLGIKASRYEWLLFTEPDCLPSGDQWIRLMARNFTPDTDIVLGYSRYAGHRGIVSSLLAGSHLLRSLRYLGMALAGHPYMGNGRNLAYRKSLFFRYNGYSQQLNLKRGEDVLFINQAATAGNTRIETSPGSVMQIEPYSLKKHFSELEEYEASAHYCRGFQRYAWGAETCLQHLFNLSVISGAVYSFLAGQWLLAGICCLLGLFRLIIQWVLFGSIARHLGHTRFTRLLPCALYGWQLFESALVRLRRLARGERPFRRSWPLSSEK